MSKCVFAGTFDPLTIGHYNIIEKCIKSYDEVFIVIGENKDKTPLLPLDVRYNCLIKTFGEKAKIIKYADYKDNYIKFLSENNIEYYVRGIRSEKDKAYEDKQIQENKKLYPFVKTVYLTPDKEFINVSSTLVRKVILSGKDYSKFIPKETENLLSEYLNSIKINDKN